jgi:PKHD-type hydroxylase
MIYAEPFLQNYRSKEIDYMNYYWFKNAFTDEEIEKIIGIGKSLELYNGLIGGHDTVENHDVRRSMIGFIECNPETEWIFERIGEHVVTANNELWNFDLMGFGDDVQFTEYWGENGGHYNWHTDIGETVCARKLSVIVQLSNEDEYEGGNVQMNIGHNTFTFPKEKGSMIIFPTFCLHRVTPVTDGVRRSLVSWVTGPNFR